MTPFTWLGLLLLTMFAVLLVKRWRVSAFAWGAAAVAVVCLFPLAVLAQTTGATPDVPWTRAEVIATILTTGVLPLALKLLQVLGQLLPASIAWLQSHTALNNHAAASTIKDQVIGDIGVFAKEALVELAADAPALAANPTKAQAAKTASDVLAAWTAHAKSDGSYDAVKGLFSGDEAAVLRFVQSAIAGALPAAAPTAVAPAIPPVPAPAQSPA